MKLNAESEVKELVIRWKEEMSMKRGERKKERILRKKILIIHFPDFLLLVVDM